MTSSSRTFEISPLAIEVTFRARRVVDRDTAHWEDKNPGARSQLPDELAEALEFLARHPRAGRAVSRRRRNDRKLHLRRTGFFVVYRIHPRLRLIRIITLVPEASLAHRR